MTLGWRELLVVGCLTAVLAAQQSQPVARATGDELTPVAPGQDKDQEFYNTLPEADRKALDALAATPRVRHFKLVELRLNHFLNRLIDDGRARSIVDDAEAARLRSMPVAERAEAALDLQKRIFIAAHDEDWRGLGAGRRADLSRLAPRQFFEDPFIRGFRTFQFFTRAELARMKVADSEVLNTVISGLDRGEVDAQASTLFSAQRLTDLKARPTDELHRLARDLRSVHLARQLPPTGGGPTVARRRHEPRLPPELFERLTAAEQRIYEQMSDDARDQFAQRRFGATLVRDELGREVRRQMPQSVRAAFETLTPAEQKELLDLPPQDFHVRMRLRFPEAFPGPARRAAREGRQQGEPAPSVPSVPGRPQPPEARPPHDPPASGPERPSGGPGGDPPRPPAGKPPRGS